MSPIHTTGMEFDIETQSLDGSESLLCECKAHEEKIETGELLKFFGKLCHQRSNNESLRGYFFSTSGFNGTALKNYQELSDKDKDIFKIFDNEEILELLEKSGLLTSEEKIESKIKSITDYELGDRYLILLKSQLYIIQMIKLAGVNKNYIILTGNGEIVDKTIRQEISNIDNRLSSLKEIDLALIKEVILRMVELIPKTIEHLIKTKWFPIQLLNEI